MPPVIRFLAGFCCALVACLAWGAEDTGGAAPDTTLTPDTGEFEEALSELEDAGSPLAGERLQEILADVPAPGHGTVLWRQTLQAGCLPPGYLKLDFTRDSLLGKVRSSREGCRQGRWRGSFSWSGGGIRLWAGDVAMAHGFGLLSARPGRTASPTADRSLGPGTKCLQAWPYAPSGSALRGVGVHLEKGGLALDTLAGARAGPLPGPAPSYRLLRLSCGEDDGGPALALLGLWGGPQPGFSLAAASGPGRIEAACEAAAGAPSTDGPGSRSFMGRVALRGFLPAKVEGAAAWSCGGQPSPLAQRPAVLSGWEGRGWALRSVARPVRGMTLNCLVAGAEEADPTGTQLSRRGLVEFMAGFVPSPGWRGSLRWRDRRDGGEAVSPRYPWQPVLAAETEHEITTAAVLTWTGAGARVRTSVRSRDTAAAGEGAARYLWTVSGRWLTDNRWRLRASWGTAWGDETDLVSVLSPLRGYVIPRHWSRWRQEWMIGAGREIGSWRLQAGIAVRDPAPSSAPRKMAVQGWLEASAHW